MIEHGSKIEQLERKITELERKVAELPKKDEIIGDLETRLANYETDLRSDKGEIILRKNLSIKNRRAMESEHLSGIVNPATDNAFSISFNKKMEGRLNHIFLGYDSLGGNYNNSVLSGAVVAKDGVPDITFQGQKMPNPNNGTIQFKVYNEENMKNGRPDASSNDGGQPNIVVSSRKNFIGQQGVDGVVSQLIGTGLNPYVSIGTYVGNSQSASTFVACDKDNVLISGIPTSDPEVANALWRDENDLKISTG